MSAWTQVPRYSGRRAVWPAHVDVRQDVIASIKVGGITLTCCMDGPAVTAIKVGDQWLRAEFAFDSDFLDAVEAAYQEFAL